MLENEGNEIENTSGVDQEVSQEPQTESQPGTQEASPAQEQKEVPFHEHPRWKEVMAERDAERQARAQLQEQIAQMQRRLEEAARPKDNKPDFKEISSKMNERLKGIDPEFQSYMSMLEQQALSAKEELAAFREEQFVNRAVSRFDELTKADQVPTELTSLYRAQLDQAYREGKIRSLEDLEKTYKSIHEPLKAYLEKDRQAHLSKYAADKKSAATKPAPQSKGRAATPGETPTRFANDGQRRAAIVKDIVAQMQAGKDLG